jgi:CubicO group peptidase (beta-lactamase class C family)
MKSKIAILGLVVLSIYGIWFFKTTHQEKTEILNDANNKKSSFDQEPTKQLIQDYIRKHPVNGVVLVALKDQILFNEAYGTKNKGKQLNNDKNTEFLIGSISKLFTAAAILKLEEEGKIDLKKHISDYLKPNHPVWSSNFPGFAQDITIEQLLTHSSGLEDYSKLPGFVKFNLDVHTRDEVIQFFSDYPLKFFPGSQYDYSGSGFTLLGAIIEEITGEKYETYLNTQFFQPLGMLSTFIPPMNFLSIHQENYPQLAVGYMEEGRNRTLTEVEDINLSSYFADASAISTAEDLYTWIKALFNGLIIEPEQLKQMTTPYFETKTKGLFTGYGLFIATEKNRPAIIVSTGAIGGYEGILSYEPKNEIAVIVLSNVMNDKTATIAKDLMNILQTETTPK